MTPENFAYWLQGYFEIQATNAKMTLAPEQVEVIKDRLKLVLENRTVRPVQGAASAIQITPAVPNTRAFC